MPYPRKLTVLLLLILLPMCICFCLVLLGPAIQLDQFSQTRFRVIGWSPDGRYVAFTATQGGGSDFWSYAYLIDADGKNLRKLSRNPVQGNGAWLPTENKLLLILSIQGSDPELFLVDIPVGSTRQLTFNDMYEFEFEWSPDGAQVIIWGTHYNPTRSDGLYLLTREGGEPKLLQNFDDALIGSDFAWSPEGLYVAFLLGDRLYVTNPASSQVDAVTPEDQIIEEFTWGDEGRRLFYRTESATFEIGAEGGTPHPTDDHTFTPPMPGILSPDGTLKAKEGCADPGQAPEYTATLDVFPCQKFELHLLNASDNSLHARITRDDLRTGELGGLRWLALGVVVVILASPVVYLAYRRRRPPPLDPTIRPTQIN